MPAVSAPLHPAAARARSGDLGQPILVDLSPLLINRTAIFAIGRDVCDILAKAGNFDVRYRFFGEIDRDWPDGQKASRLRDVFGSARAAAAGQRIGDWLPPGNDRPRIAGGAPVRALLLDPLYVLFAPLVRSDIVLCLDLSTLTHPEWHDPVVGRLYQEAFRRIIEVEPELIMISQNTADTFYANFGAYRNRTTVVPLYPPKAIEAAARSGRAARFRPAGPYFLFVGSLEARKNVIGAIDAFDGSGLAADGYRLYIVGGAGHGATAVEHRAREVSGVVLAGYVGDEVLCSMYAGATGFLYPSYLEGFGVPLLEAMLFGLPSIATTAGASPEVGGPLVWYRDPDDHVGMAQDLRALTRLAADERERIAEGLRERARSEFSFGRFADRLLQALTDAPAGS